jgi:hypothetical protein
VTSQESIERDLRLLIGDLQVQVIVLRAQLAEQIEQAAEQATEKSMAGKLNGGMRPPVAEGTRDAVRLPE